MARVFISGFESQSLPASTDQGAIDAVLNAGASGVTIDTATFRTGAAALKVAAASGTNASVVMRLGSSYIRVYVLVSARPSTTARVLLGSTSSVSVRLNPNGTLAVFNGGVLQGTSAVALTDTSHWYCVELRTADGSSVAVLRVDEKDEVVASPSAWNTVSRLGANDSVADTYTAFFDDFVADDAAYVGPGAVVILRPTSLNAAGSWKDGDGSTAPAASTVAKSPPPGVASANEVVGTNIKSAANSATDNCDMNMTTYLAAGVSGIVHAVQAVVRQGEDISTGTKTGAQTIVSNPTQSGEDTFTFGNDGGAHGAETGLWLASIGTLQQNPAVTLETAPVLRVGKRTATTRVVCVDFMGIYVDFTPGPIPHQSPYPQLLPQ